MAIRCLSNVANIYELFNGYPLVESSYQLPIDSMSILCTKYPLAIQWLSITQYYYGQRELHVHVLSIGSHFSFGVVVRLLVAWSSEWC
jgi:hypothetical protein